MSRVKYTWFTDPKGDPRTTRLIGLVLGSEDECLDQLCEDGKHRNLWRWHSHEEMRGFMRTADANRWPYDIYVRAGDYGPICQWKFEEPVVSAKEKIGRNRTAGSLLCM